MGHDLRYALRSILSHPWFSAAVVVTVAMGIGVNTMVFTLVNAVLLKPLAVPHGERIVVLSNSNLAHNDDSMRISYPDFRTPPPGCSTCCISGPSWDADLYPPMTNLEPRRSCCLAMGSGKTDTAVPLQSSAVQCARTTRRRQLSG
jgi:hypothetical protein